MSVFQMNEDGQPNFNHQFQNETGNQMHSTPENLPQGFMNSDPVGPEPPRTFAEPPRTLAEPPRTMAEPPRTLAEPPRTLADLQPVPPQTYVQPAPVQNHVQEHVQRVEPEVKSEPNSPLPTDPAMQAILAYLRKHNLGDTETVLKDELKKREVAVMKATQILDPEVGNVLAAYRSDGDPSSYESAYRCGESQYKEITE